jgi:hypothetical protein
MKMGRDNVFHGKIYGAREETVFMGSLVQRLGTLSQGGDFHGGA